MALVANSFLKAIPVTYGSAVSPDPDDTTTSIQRTFSIGHNRIEDLSTVLVYYNGQLIEKSSDNPTGKFYYTVVPTLIPSASAMTTTWIPGSTVPTDTSSVVFHIFPNPSYTGIGYSTGTATDIFSVEDSIVISYYYVVYTVA